MIYTSIQLITSYDGSFGRTWSLFDDTFVGRPVRYAQYICQPSKGNSCIHFPVSPRRSRSATQTWLSRCTGAAIRPTAPGSPATQL